MQETLTRESEDTGSGYMSKADLRREFGFSDVHFAQLGPADRSQPDAAAGPAELHRVYSRVRVEQWVAENRELVEDLQARREAREARSAREREEADARRTDVRRQIAAHLRDWQKRALAPLEPPLAQLRSSLNAGAGADGAAGMEHAIFTYILETHTDYAALVRMLNRLEAGFELSAAARILVCGRIIREYQLHLDPLEVAFPSGARSMLPREFTAGDPEQVAAAIIGLDP
jgi:hypothetical protein